MRFLAAVAQLNTTTDKEASVASATRLVEQAAALGAKLVVLPENVSFMGSEQEKLRHVEPLDGPTFGHFAALAGRLQIHLLAGSLPERSADPGKAFNSSVLYGPDGQRVAVYRKIHLFDVSLGEGATHLESASVTPGDQAVVAELLSSKLGMSVCYDVRFPDLYRSLVRAGAELLSVPAAFTVPTGRDHWEILLRARAIESQCFVFAAGQVGQNTPTRQTYGRSMIIDPWGTILAQCPDRPAIALAEIDLEHLRALRRKLPCLSHERPAAYRVQ